MGADVPQETVEQRRKAKAKKGKKPQKSEGSGSAYTVSDGGETIDESSDAVMGDGIVDDDLEDLSNQVQQRMTQGSSPGYVPPQPRQRSPQPAVAVAPLCGLCGDRHGDGFGECSMTDKSENLAEYREILILHAVDEDWEIRVSFTISSRKFGPKHSFRMLQSKRSMKYFVLVAISI
jgi:chromodomain-helicase-DNA-binding protein 4